MPKFKKRPVVIEAVRAKDVIAAYQHDWQLAPDWLRAARDRGGVNIEADGVIVATPEGVMRAGVDDWIVKGVEDEVYPCKASVFASSYDEVPEEIDLEETVVPLDDTVSIDPPSTVRMGLEQPVRKQEPK